MPPIDLLIAFFVSTALFAFVPGPAMLYAAARTLAGGRRAGLMAALGASRILAGLRSSPSLGRWLQRVAGSLLIGLGARLALDRG